MSDPKRSLIKTALYSRTTVLCLQFLGNWLLPDHDAGVFVYPKSNETVSLAGGVITSVLGGFARWDAQYFLHIAKHGYVYENSLAFFPLFPLLVRYIAYLLQFPLYFIDFDALLLLTSVSVNLILFILASLTLYDLSRSILLDDRLAFKSTLLFCYNPASIFFSAPYTESLFSYLTFQSMLNCVRLYNQKYFNYLHVLLCIIPISLSALTRSNGVLNIGYLVFIIISLILKKNRLNKFYLVLLLFFSIGFCLLPFILYQIYVYKLFCFDDIELIDKLPVEVLNYSRLKSLVLPGQFTKHNQSWCHNTIPLSYNYVQDHYWNVGFLRYYQIKQLPNFILASPIVYIIGSGCIRYLKTLDFRFVFPDQKSTNRSFFTAFLMFPFVVHAAALTLFCVLFIHVQVTTRMLCSASPVVYWFVAVQFNGSFSFRDMIKRHRIRDYSFYILIYFLGYFAVGTVMFANFLPWT